MVVGLIPWLDSISNTRVAIPYPILGAGDCLIPWPGYAACYKGLDMASDTRCFCGTWNGEENFSAYIASGV
jgi:hypothetical protein